ncbi:Mitogen-activated protein kinase kinase kinase [Sesamum alatum]|uniref:Mitogen-activated protein kinase kinase kinase n=1 Tax=Sesamum alatum TaxID=300844 RepID=A0AAE2CG36_9LAMI|nr:Mitogen-activated protein kinase kinase kinase [Sesamum alatum]
MEWTRGPTIGRGSSAAVSIATTASGDLFAVKSTDLSSSTLLQREERLVSQLCSPYVVKCFGSEITWEENKHVYNLFLEYVAGGALSDQIGKQGGSLDEGVIRFYAREMLLGLRYLHLMGLVHCDIKGQNILIGSDGLKIADFGCAKWGESGGSAFSGTPAYMAPEVARGEEQSFPADIWALGCTIIEMATGSNPWPEMKDPASALYRIAFSGDVPKFPSWFSDNAKDLLAKCLTREPRERWTADELLQHPFFSSAEANCVEFNRKSPTSVMDQGFWDTLEVLTCSSRNKTEIASPSDSPAGRIRALIGDPSPSNVNSTGWTEEEDWLTVRGNEIEECSEVGEQSEDPNQDLEELIDDEFTAISRFDEEEIQTSILVENSLLECVNGDSESVEDFSVFKLITCEKCVNGNISSSRSTFPTTFYSLLWFLGNIIDCR